jgi:hypothetical protein
MHYSKVPAFFGFYNIVPLRLPLSLPPLFFLCRTPPPLPGHVRRPAAPALLWPEPRAAPPLAAAFPDPALATPCPCHVVRGLPELILAAARRRSDSSATSCFRRPTCRSPARRRRNLPQLPSSASATPPLQTCHPPRSPRTPSIPNTASHRCVLSSDLRHVWMPYCIFSSAPATQSHRHLSFTELTPHRTSAVAPDHRRQLPTPPPNPNPTLLEHHRDSLQLIDPPNSIFLHRSVVSHSAGELRSAAIQPHRRQPSPRLPILDPEHKQHPRCPLVLPNPSKLAPVHQNHRTAAPANSLLRRRSASSSTR